MPRTHQDVPVCIFDLSLFLDRTSWKLEFCLCFLAVTKLAIRAHEKIAFKFHDLGSFSFVIFVCVY